MKTSNTQRPCRRNASTVLALRQRLALKSAMKQCHACGQQQATTTSISPSLKNALLVKHIKSHTAALTSAIVLEDSDQCKQFITSSLDKNVTHWTLTDFSDISKPQQLESSQYKIPGIPVFSMLPSDAAASTKDSQPNVYLGTSAKEVRCLSPSTGTLLQQVNMDGHTGWVRSLAISGKWLFSCGCNYLRQWDITFAKPKEVKSIKLFTGDILDIATGSNRVFTAGADGSIRSWILTKSGSLEAGPQREKAHDGRVTRLLTHNNFLYSVSFDGSIKGWNAESLDLVMEVKNAHDGQRIHCMALGKNGVLYTGGDDKMVRRWHAAVLEQLDSPLYGHDSSVRVLAAGKNGCLVSGDKSGEVCVWEV